MRALLIVLSFFIVAFGQPAWIPWLGPIAAICGYALLWWARPSFWLATAWFTGVMLLQLSWMAVDEYHGLYIWFSWGALSLLCGLQFGLLTKLKYRLIIPCAWVLMEYLRLYLLSGFTWNPVGLALTAYAPSRAFVALFGIYGLSFIVMAANVLFYQRKFVLAALCAALPYGYGLVHLHWPTAETSHFAVLLVQPGITPGQRQEVPHSRQEVMSPLEQWRSMLDQVLTYRDQKIDLIVFPEGMAPYSGTSLLFCEEVAQGMFAGAMGQGQFPVASGLLGALGYVNSAYVCQTLSNAFGCDVVAGLDWHSEGKSYNAALHFSPGCQGPVGIYGKRVLLPFAETLPTKWLRPLTAKYGIEGFYTKGEGAKCFASKVPLAPLVCYEETFGNLVRESSKLDVSLLVSLSNDGWYPRSKLPLQHFHHGRLRAVENGIPLVRACSTGVCAAVDHRGRTLAVFPHFEGKGVLQVDVPLQRTRTLYKWLGDLPILGLSVFGFLLYFTFRKKQ
ncbi:MAG: apolipoprotein N-acyltransferase [Verrucomicrobia bacterium]|nr:apolipoprotein N-acyltransferase [Verrucomicrobiota bacterium]